MKYTGAGFLLPKLESVSSVKILTPGSAFVDTKILLKWRSHMFYFILPFKYPEWQTRLCFGSAGKEFPVLRFTYGRPPIA